MSILDVKRSPIKTNLRSVRDNIDLKRGSESAVRTVSGNEFQQSMDLLTIKRIPNSYGIWCSSLRLSLFEQPYMAILFR
jgi:hypothetical protein